MGEIGNFGVSETQLKPPGFSEKTEGIVTVKSIPATEVEMWGL